MLSIAVVRVRLKESLAKRHRYARGWCSAVTVRRVGMLCVVVLALGPGVGIAQARHGHNAGDVAATRRYLLALHEQTLATQGLHAAERARITALPARVTTQCANVLAGAPETPAPYELGGSATNHLANEVEIEAAHMFEEPERSAEIAFARSVIELRWSNRRLTQFAHGLAEEERANAELPLPDICADASAFAKSAFQSVPPSTTRLLRENQAANDRIALTVKRPEYPDGQPTTKILKLLKPYEQPDEKSIIPSLASPHELPTLALVEEKTTETLRALGLKHETAAAGGRIQGAI